MPERRWIVTASGDRSVTELAEDLARQEFIVEQVLAQITPGVIIGTAEDHVIDHVRRLPGVGNVAPDEPVDIGPPDAPIS